MTAPPPRFTRRTSLMATAALALSGLSCTTTSPAVQARDGRLTARFDDDWRFLRADVAGAEDVALDDADWRRLDLPHDWSIEDAPGAPKTTGAWTPPSARWRPRSRWTR